MSGRTVEEDMISEIASGSRVKDIAYYEVTICAIVHDKYNVKTQFFSYTFVSPGMTDQKRMRRALYYFDIALFNHGVHKHRLLSTRYNTDDRTGAMYQAMVDAYNYMWNHASKFDDDPNVFVTMVKQLQNSDTNVVASSSERPIYFLVNRPEPISYNLVHCQNCLRVQEKDELSDENEFKCNVCVRQLKKKGLDP